MKPNSMWKIISYATAAKMGGKCYDSHSTATPGVTEKYARSKHATKWKMPL